MKKKRVTKSSDKKTPKRSLAAKNKISPASRVKKTTKSASKSNPKTPRSSRITKALKAVPAIDKKPLKKLPAGKKTEVDPLSAALPRVETINDLPFSYNTTEIVLMLRDPFWAFTYWDFSGETWRWMAELCERDAGAKAKLRVHLVEQGYFYDHDVNLEAKSWYLDLGIPNASFEVELGILDSRGKFHSITRSNRIKTPRSGPSDTIDPQWELSDFERSHLYSLAASGRGRAGASSHVFSSLKRPKK